MPAIPKLERVRRLWTKQPELRSRPALETVKALKAQNVTISEKYVYMLKNELPQTGLSNVNAPPETERSNDDRPRMNRDATKGTDFQPPFRPKQQELFTMETERFVALANQFHSLKELVGGWANFRLIAQALERAEKPAS